MKRLLTLAAIAAAATLAGSSSFGQTPPPAPPTQQAQPDRAAWRHRVCTEHYARTVGRVAYLEAKLELTPDQQPLWAKWRDAVNAGAAPVRDACSQSPSQSGERPNVVERQAYIGRVVMARAQALQNAQPALAALYEALHPEQREILDRPPGGHHGWHHGPHGGPQGRGPQGQGPQQRGPGGMGGGDRR